MEKLTTKKAQASLGTLGILWAALRTSARNGKLLVSIMVYVSISFSVLAFFGHLALTPIVTDLSSKLAILETNRMISSVATISSSYEAYTAKVLTLEDMFLKIGRRWTRPVITSFYATLISLSIIILFLIFIGVFSAITNGFLLILLNIVVAILGAVCDVYVAAVFLLSVVVSIVENDSGGLKAIDRATEIMKGKKLQGCVLMLLFVFASGTVYVISLVQMGKRQSRLDEAGHQGHQDLGALPGENLHVCGVHSLLP
ncbi:unnamed protein product [Ilex paraguariensis]|uniref:Uncharacterized protein n=1 Tax=Ilex paraguariensis TaxID=185542 RepID=A0ABC8TB30_9AQUA